jgi:hypothetical protein
MDHTRLNMNMTIKTSIVRRQISVLKHSCGATIYPNIYAGIRINRVRMMLRNKAARMTILFRLHQYPSLVST